MKSNLSLSIARTTASPTAAALICGFWSYVATSFGDGIISRSSPGERLLAPAVEEVRHVRVLLRLGAAELREAGARDDLGEDVVVVRLRERDRAGRSCASYVVMQA